MQMMHITQGNRKMTTLKPQGAQVFFDGSFYKIGLHGLSYRYDGKAWTRSTKTTNEIAAEIKRQVRT